MIAGYLEHALQFEQMALDATDAALKESLLKQAAAYRKLAEERAERLRIGQSQAVTAPAPDRTARHGALASGLPAKTRKNSAP